MKLDDLEVPVTSACRAALEVATAYCSRALLNHSVRAYLWAAGYGLERGIAFDAELLYVSAMLHDLALVNVIFRATMYQLFSAMLYQSCSAMVYQHLSAMMYHSAAEPPSNPLCSRRHPSRRREGIWQAGEKTRWIFANCCDTSN